jgi:hypothetical protein
MIEQPRRGVTITDLFLVDVSPLRGLGFIFFRVPRLAPWATDLLPLHGSLTLIPTKSRTQRRRPRIANGVFGLNDDE